MLTDPVTLAKYNAWANARLHAACATLPHADLVKPRKAFFGTILGTLNHILLVDILYRDRLEKNPVRFQSLRETLHPELSPLSADQRAQDAWYIDHMAALGPDKLAEPFPFYTLPDNEYWSLPLEICLANLFQHQIHHRGQTHNMLSQADLDPPPLDYIAFRIEHG
jgi:uncharacterized damage-inducible protein DinB